jgi:uncharacterized protein YgiB involved in biofilm formation
MKRSSSIRLTLMGAVTAGSLSACDSGITHPGNFTSVGSCMEAGNSSKACIAAQNAAYSSHEASAPRFATREECLQKIDVTDCVQARIRNPDGTFATMFLPAMAGFMAGQALAQQPQQQSSGGSSGGGGGGGGRAFYASRDYPNQYRDAGNLSGSRSGVASPSQALTTTAPSRPPNVHTTTIARSGFGSSSSFHGGGSS